MSKLRSALALSYPALKIFRKSRQFRCVGESKSIRVLLYHDIQPEEYTSFQLQLEWLSHRWTFISPDDFSNIINGNTTINSDSLLLTFDDGFASNRRIVEEILNPIGIKALFFIVSDFANIEDEEEARQFVIQHIQPGISRDNLPKHLTNMRWPDLEALLDYGHTIGAHTRTHARLSGINSSERLSDEIVSSADQLEKRLGIDIEHFAYTFGDLTSFSRQALGVAQQRFRFVYSGLRGNNLDGSPSSVIRRDALNPTDPTALVGAFLEGGADFLYRRALKSLELWSEKSNC